MGGILILRPDPLSTISPIRSLEETYNAKSESMHLQQLGGFIIKKLYKVFFSVRLIDYRYVENK